ncbi:FAD-dependent monooxygenase [Chitinophaga ginsengisoli]|uniref:2-polyprenyl-6-methoxyphenol hydroxylase-like FAD-dependent oxidoreductase n=1 Tax=Chitinophaga ginsengisoli TaxID=363837 RepID=A0A2P8G5A2_9BACT|nr:FAD-dependent monooxygenase [Chitinophaga ginsengisoli]PSL29126.1 2-polyprenyl-6-methoxyphenol hydroxylase-like FAD-dependent oxidoreductase [Chitinophaga ginsengisoli]
MKKRIIISGGGIAGLTAAKLLHNMGHEIIVIDKSKQFNKSGFLVSLKSFGVEIMDEIGLKHHLIAESTPSEFMHWLDANGGMIRNISYKEVNKNTSQSILITRGGLHNVLYEDIRDKVEILFKTTIDHLEQDGGKVHVKLSNGITAVADMVIVSEGLRSLTRSKYFPESQLEDFNLLYMGGRLMGKHSDNIGTVSIYLDVNKMLSIYPISSNEVAVQCYIYTTDELAKVHSNIKEILKDNFKSYNAEVRQLIDGITESGQPFVDKMGMVHAPDLFNGNVVLLGDAGYCPTALSGMGASLSIYGAKALAHFLSQSSNDISTSLVNYDKLMKPIIKKFQENARNNARSFIPKSEADLSRFSELFKTASDSEVSKMMTDQLILTAEQKKFIIN